VKRPLPLLLAAALAGCAVKAGTAASECTFATEKSRGEFCAQARDLGARARRDDAGLHVTLDGEPGTSSSWAKALMARESTCCPHLKFRLEQGEDVNILHVSADNDPGAIDRLDRLLQQR